jgi:hypothetical protein
MEFTSVELAGCAELATPMEKATTGLVEKVAVGPRAGEGRGGRGGAVEREEDRLLGRGGDIGQRSGGTMERGAVAEAARRSTVAERCHGAVVR